MLKYPDQPPDCQLFKGQEFPYQTAIDHPDMVAAYKSLIERQRREPGYVTPEHVKERRGLIERQREQVA